MFDIAPKETAPHSLLAIPAERYGALGAGINTEFCGQTRHNSFNILF